MPSAFISVSLAAAGQDDDDVQGIARCVEAFARETGWNPKHVNHAEGAFRFARVVAGQDLELTDWQALEQFIDGVAPRAVAKA